MGDNVIIPNDTEDNNEWLGKALAMSSSYAVYTHKNSKAAERVKSMYSYLKNDAELKKSNLSDLMSEIYHCNFVDDVVDFFEQFNFNDSMVQRGIEMDKYLIGHGINKETAREMTGYYLYGLKNRIDNMELSKSSPYYSNIANLDGTEINEKTFNYIQGLCFRLAESEQSIVEELGNSSIQQLLKDNNVNDLDINRITVTYVSGAKSMLANECLVKNDGIVESSPATNPIAKIDQPKPTYYLENEGTLKGGVNYHYDRRTDAIYLDGDGALTQKDGRDISYSFSPKILIIGKDVKFDDTVNGEEDDYYSWLHTMLLLRKTTVYAYRNSYTEAEYNKIIDVEHAAYNEGTTVTKDDLREFYVINYLDDSVDPYAILDGTSGIKPLPKPKHIRQRDRLNTVEETASQKTDNNVTVLNSETKNEVATEGKTVKAETKPAVKATLTGDADLNSEVGLADVITVSKYTASSAKYPLKNDVAKANADMNGDGNVDGMDTSALIEYSLGNG